MPTQRFMPCAQCCQPMKSHLPEGTAICQPCRRIAKGCSPSTPMRNTPRTCHICGTEFYRRSQQGCTEPKYCTKQCARTPRRTRPRPSAHWRGYNAAHQRERARLTPLIDNGQGYCAQPICLEPIRWIEPGTLWDLGHDDTQTTWIGPTHRRCNRADGAHKAALTITGDRLRRWYPPRLPKPPHPCPVCTKATTRPIYCGVDCRREAAAIRKPPKPIRPCLACSKPTTRRVFCSNDCQLETAAIRTRNLYRQAHDLSPDYRPRTRQNPEFLKG
jgi:hypothetical protein